MSGTERSPWVALVLSEGALSIQADPEPAWASARVTRFREFVQAALENGAAHWIDTIVQWPTEPPPDSTPSLVEGHLNDPVPGLGSHGDPGGDQGGES
jgi:hypothetical protein